MVVLDRNIQGFRGNYGVPPRVVYSNQEDKRYADRRKGIRSCARNIARQRDDDEISHHEHIMRNWQKELIG